MDRIAKCLLVDMDVGLPSEENHEELYEARAAAFGRNVYPEQPPKAFWVGRSAHEITNACDVNSTVCSLRPTTFPASSLFFR